MRVIRIAGCSLLLAALFMMAIIWNASPVAGECASCKAAGSSAEQDPLNQQWASFLGEVGAWSQMPFHPGLLRAQSDSSNCSSLWGENGERGLDLNLSAPKDGLQKYQGNRSDMARGMGFSTILISPEEIKILDSSDIIIDISPRSTEYIPGAISIPYDRFIDPAGRLEPIGEMARILGEAGVSENDSIIIYGECQPCGGGPSAATYVFWMLKFLGHEDVRLLDGGIDDWVAASNPTWSEPARLAPRNYTPAIDADLLATYDFVCSGIPQIIDARTGRDFEAGSIPGSGRPWFTWPVREARRNVWRSPWRSSPRWSDSRTRSRPSPSTCGARTSTRAPRHRSWLSSRSDPRRRGWRRSSASSWWAWASPPSASASPGRSSWESPPSRP